MSSTFGGPSPDGPAVGIAANPVGPGYLIATAQGAIVAWSDPVTTRTNRWKRSWSGYYTEILEQVCAQFKIDMDEPWQDLPEKQRQIILHGGGTYTPSWAKNPHSCPL